MQQLFLHLMHCFFGNNQGDLEKRWKNGEMRYFVKKLGSGNVGLQDPPPPPPPPTPPRSLTDLDYCHTFFFWYLQKRKTKAVIIRELKPVKQRRRPRQRERQKSNRFRLAKQQLCTLLHDHNVKVPNFTFCRGRGHKTTTLFFFLFLNFDTVL